MRLIDGWTLINIVIQIACMAAFGLLAGGAPFKYLVASTVFAIGFHPLGARWIQEHFALVPDQETYSYYGPLNKVSFNVGYHNEHHDLVTIPWSRLPQIRRIAPEFYDGLHSYDSWTALLVRFVRDRDITLFRYIVRPGRDDRHASRRMTAAPYVRPLRIGVCAPYDLGRDGGVNSHIRAQARALRRLGHDVVVFGASSAPLGDGEVVARRQRLARDRRHRDRIRPRSARAAPCDRSASRRSASTSCTCTSR